MLFFQVVVLLADLASSLGRCYDLLDKSQVIEPRKRSPFPKCLTLFYESCWTILFGVELFMLEIQRYFTKAI